MKYIKFILLGIILIFALTSMSIAQDVEKIDFPKLNKIQIPDIEKITLENGITLYLLEDNSLPIFNVRTRINCGSYLEEADKVGLSSICGSVMRTGGTSKWTGDEIDELLEGIGGSVETSIGMTSGNATVNVLSEYSELGLEVLAEILRRPVFDQDKIDLAKVQERTGISRRNDDVGSVARREFTKQIYGKDSPYARTVEYTTLDAINRDDLVEFHKTYIQPQNIQLAIWGDIDKKNVIKLIKKYFGDWAIGSTEVPPPPRVDYDYRSKVYYAEKKDAKQSYIRVGHIGGTVFDDDYTDRIVMNSILGGGFGSRVTDAVRTKLGLAYSAGGRYISNFAYPGYFFMIASTKPSSTIKAAKEMIKQIKSMHTNPPTKTEMKKGKDGYLNSFVFNFDTKSEVINRMMTYDFYNLPSDFLQQEKEKVEKVSPEDVVAAAKNNIRTDQMIVLVAGNKDEFDEPLTSLGLGEAEMIDISIPSPENNQELEITEENLKKGKNLLDKAVVAAGGIDSYKNINAISIKGQMLISTPNGEFAVNLQKMEAYPDKQFSLIEVMGRKMYDITNGNTGWKTDQATGELVQKTEDDMIEVNKDFSRNVNLLFKESDNPSYQTVYNGSGNENGQAVEYVALVDKTGEVICTFGFNNQTYQLVSKSHFGTTQIGEGLVIKYMDDFQEIDGAKIPMTVETHMNDQKLMTLKIEEFLINPTLPSNQFDKP
ncbi:MAG: pitrilysin family protein [candidate division Zixibacteria bacterium]|nr:pitrilysin family protein [candidate division Zixibacteria bacterium]